MNLNLFLKISTILLFESLFEYFPINWYAKHEFSQFFSPVTTCASNFQTSSYDGITPIKVVGNSRR